VLTGGGGLLLVLIVLVGIAEASSYPPSSFLAESSYHILKFCAKLEIKV